MIDKTSREKIEDALVCNEDLLQPGDSVQFVSDTMSALGTNVLPVSEGGILMALADKPDPGRDASSYGHDPHTTKIASTMNRDLVFCYEDDECSDALHKMEGRNLSHLPVVDRNMRIIALAAREDLARRVAEATESHTAAGHVTK